MSTESGRPAGYSGTQKLLHWVVALLVFALIPVGFYMVRRGALTNFDAMTNELYTAHKTFGIIVLALMVARIIVRIHAGSPAPEPSLNRFQVIVSEAVHGLIYLALLAVPLLGWLGVSAYGARGILGGFQLPALLGKDTLLGEAILKYHGYAAIVLVLLIGAHVGAALFHRIILKDGVLRRMLP